jgi:hypothetical protein
MQEETQQEVDPQEQTSRREDNILHTVTGQLPNMILSGSVEAQGKR